ncbi:MAG: hypothetical protein MUE60_11200 [Candidatus Eisenbacteria bacterium]|jgi:hypothetical protein|nr:hypothetical protein [Candidatus Eisenbacteria bacterium]
MGASGRRIAFWVTLLLLSIASALPAQVPAGSSMNRVQGMGAVDDAVPDPESETAPPPSYGNQAGDTREGPRGVGEGEEAKASPPGSASSPSEQPRPPEDAPRGATSLVVDEISVS